MQTTDKTLIDRFLGGDHDSFNAIVTRWEKPVLNLAYRLTNDLEEAKDVRQTAFVKAYQGLSTFNGEARFSTWLYRVVVNQCRDRMRARKSRESVLREMTARSSSESISSPAHDTERVETARIVADAVAALPEAEREVLVLRHYHDRNFPEIAAILGAPASTVKSRMERALKTLRIRLKQLDL